MFQSHETVVSYWMENEVNMLSDKLSFEKWYSSANGERVENNDTFMNNFFLKLKPEDKITLYSRNKKKLKNIFGKQTACWNGLGYRYWVWEREYKNYTFLVFASERGMSIEVVSKGEYADLFNEETGEIMIEFTEDLIKKLKLWN